MKTYEFFPNLTSKASKRGGKCHQDARRRGGSYNRHRAIPVGRIIGLRKGVDGNDEHEAYEYIFHFTAKYGSR